MIYYDNAATGGFKPRAALDALINVARYLSANPGRSGHRLSVTGAKIVGSCRETIADFFGCRPEKVIFTKNCTEALNIAILGTVKKGGKVITTVLEHNSVLRPLTRLSRYGYITLETVAPEKGESFADAVIKKLSDEVCLVVATAVSNVTGEKLPLSLIGEACSKRGIPFLADGAQGGGHIPLDMKKNGLNMLALAGHKGLCGIMGSGVLCIDDETEVMPLITGGTGTESFNLEQPMSYPERLEAGTLNLPAIAALEEGVRYVKKNLDNFGKTLSEATGKLIDELSGISGVRCYSQANEAGIVSFSVKGKDSADVADVLDSGYDVAVRGGLHCAPLTHKYLGTADGGLIRASLAVQNTSREADFFVRAIKEICKT